LCLALAEMYVQGVSTRKVSQITEELCGCEISSSDVSRATKLLDEELTKWRSRPLGAIKYLILDARYEKVREAGCVRECAVLVAIGIDAEGHRSILGVSVSLSEAEVHWREFLKPARAGTAWPGSDRERCARRTEGSAAGLLEQRALATLPVPPAA
jgi:transposase-like protein